MHKGNLWYKLPPEYGIIFARGLPEKKVSHLALRKFCTKEIMTYFSNAMYTLQ
jgi:hypothetical protein